MPSDLIDFQVLSNYSTGFYNLELSQGRKTKSIRLMKE
jgi:hypothetical protein